MFPTYRPGEVLYIEQYPYSNLKLGMEVVYLPIWSRTLVLHRIAAVYKGSYYLKGDHNKGFDQGHLTPANFIGIPHRFTP